MGAQSFIELSMGEDAGKAYDQAAEQDRYDNGHSYSGGIGCSHNFRKLAVAAMTEEEAYALADQLHAANDRRVSDKWGECLAIPVKLTQREVQIGGLEGSYSSPEELTELALAKARTSKLIRRGEKAKSFWLNSYQTPRSSYGYSGYGYRYSPVVSTPSRFTQGSGILTLIKGKTAFAAQQTPDAWLFVGTAPS